MEWKVKGKIVICALLAMLAFILPASAADVNPEESPVPSETVRTAPVMLIPQDTGTHTQYMEGSNGLFAPEKNVTRAELAQMLARIVEDVPAGTPQFMDVSQDAWYAPAVQKIAGLGMMSGDDGAFRPSDPATRAECAAALALLLPYDAQARRTFPDVPSDYWAYDAICRTAGFGLFQGDATGNFRPDSGLKRCEAVTVFNRLLGRTPNLQSATQLGVFHFFSDVPATHWAYADIVEASITHNCAANPDGTESWTWADADWFEDGPYRINGRLYWVIDRQFVKSQYIGEFYFDVAGRYTTGNPVLDEKLNAIVESLTNDSMTRDQKLRALFDYVRDNFTYLKRPLIAKGQRGWEPEYALYFLTYGKGNCYNFSATYCLLCRELGLPAYTVVGAALNSVHGWVEIPMDGAYYIFDTQLAWRYLHDWGKTGWDFFKMPATNPIVEYTR